MGVVRIVVECCYLVVKLRRGNTHLTLNLYIYRKKSKFDFLTLYLCAPFQGIVLELCLCFENRKQLEDLEGKTHEMK